jgi:hypothetical protein
MWWNPSSDSERDVVKWLNSAEKRFISEWSKHQVWGVGSYISLKGKGSRPLVLLDEALLDEPSPVPRLLPLWLLPDRIRKDLKEWNFLETTVFLAVTEPEPLSNAHSIPVSAGDVLWCPATNEHGTIGPSVEGDDPSGNRFKGVLTAGHVTKGIGSPIDIVQQRRLLPPQCNRIGSVLYHDDPINRPGIPGYDISVVKLDTNAYISGFNPVGVAALQGPLTQPVLCSMYGGVTGIFRYAGIVGALTCYGSNNRLWSNSWLMLPSNVAAKGDSGSLVIVNSTSEAIGLLVGGSRALNTSWFLCWYAQDLFSIQNKVLLSLNVKIV